MAKQRDRQKDVTTFVDHFTEVLKEIKDLPGERAPLYREVLYVATIDALSKAVMPQRESNRDRFIYFLRRFGRWPDGERVSLPHLTALLRLNPDPAFEGLRKWVFDKYSNLPALHGELMPISQDPTFEDVKAHWPGSSEHKMPIQGVDLDALTHYRLLYAYRNMLVHELRRPGRGWDFKEGDDPYYHGLTDLGDDSRPMSVTVELVYPWKFLHRLGETTLAQVGEYCKANDLSPYESFVFGTYWIRELNR